MKLIERQYLATPFYGARKIAAWLKKLVVDLSLDNAILKEAGGGNS